MLVGKFKCLKTGMTATGLPPHTKMLEKLSVLEEKMSGIVDDDGQLKAGPIVEGVADKLDAFAAAQGNITPASLQGKLGSMKADLIEKIEEAAGGGGGGEEQPVPEAPPEAPAACETFTWGGKLQRKLAKDHKLPKGLNVEGCYRLWHVGNPADRIFPYKGVDATDFYVPRAPAGESKKKSDLGEGESFSPAMLLHKERLSQRKRFSKWSNLFQKMDSGIQGQDCFKEKPTFGELHDMYVEGMKVIKPLLFKGKNKRTIDKVCPASIYNEMKKKAKYGEDNGDDDGDGGGN